MPRFLGFAIAALTLLVACTPQSNTGSTTGGGGPAGGGSSQSGSGAAGRNASIELSGPASGTLSVQGISCQPAGSATILASISGTIGSAQYTVEASAPSAGTYQLATQSPASAGVTQTSPSFQRWAAGAGQPGGSGSLTVADRNGQIDAQAAGVQGASGTMGVKGSWTCP